MGIKGLNQVRDSIRQNQIKNTRKPKPSNSVNGNFQKENDQLAFVVRNSFSFGPNSIQVAVPNSKEVIEDNGLLTLKKGKDISYNGGISRF